MKRRKFVCACTAALAVPGATIAHAQDAFPAKLIRIVTAAPGSNNDWGARLVAQELSPRLGQQVIVENRGSVGVEVVAKAPPDGHTILFYGSIAWLQPFLTQVSWDPLRDLAPITLSMRSPNVLVVHPSVPVKSVKELIALAKARPGDLNYGAGGSGASPHLAAELFKFMAGVNIVRINYKGTGPAMVGMLGGEVHMMFPGLGSIVPHVKSGRMRALAVTTPRRSKLVPELPAVSETMPGYDSESLICFFAPAKTPPAVIARLNSEINQVMRTTDQKRLNEAGVEASGTTPEELLALIKSEMSRMSKLIKSANFTP
ncbi:MAG TPA: tripartite tricarboxylate transporter substrate-binding protein [Burkholderiales bacterium]|nr:tripartite tricarboxylate transporter substrate-binding protein [Burkholderiales bacterium]